jgi:hypothetical protein
LTNRRQQRRTQRYVNACVEILRLRQRFSVELVELDGAYAQVTRVTLDTSIIQFDSSFFGQPPVRKRLIVAHEISHALCWDLAHLIPDSHALARTEVEEMTVDTFAEIVAPWLPTWGSIR